ncbi:hypothetical protein [Bradyrhizobium sp.]|uniref:hypothetical protein n=1 Tax=Bradyrhizobium sp. TaxID=376 RepID=UPI002734016D|nr:hypothetical protein [Bradyrhizobium sp.]MDP3690663.1 hypothetical protein [Bradyrhizobium sp.]
MLRRGDYFCLFGRQQLQELLAPNLVVVGLRAELSSENGNILLMNELFHGSSLSVAAKRLCLNAGQAPDPAADIGGCHWILGRT